MKSTALGVTEALPSFRLQRSRIIDGNKSWGYYSTSPKSWGMGANPYPQLLRCAPHHWGLHYSTSPKSPPYNGILVRLCRIVVGNDCGAVK